MCVTIKSKRLPFKLDYISFNGLNQLDLYKNINCECEAKLLDEKFKEKINSLSHIQIFLTI